MCVVEGADYRADRRKKQIRNRERKGRNNVGLCREGIKIVSLSCALGKMDILNRVDGAFQSDSEGGRVRVWCTRSRLPVKMTDMKRMFVSLYPHTVTHSFASCLLLLADGRSIYGVGLASAFNIQIIHPIKVRILIHHLTSIR